MKRRKSLGVSRKSFLGNREGMGTSCRRFLGLLVMFPEDRVRFSLRLPAIHDSRFTTHGTRPYIGGRTSPPPIRCGRED